MRLPALLICAHLTLVLLMLAAGMQPARGAVAAESPTTLELIEDLRIFTVLNVLKPTRAQSTELAAIAAAGREGLAAIAADVRATLEQPRDALLVAREKLLRGEAAPPDAEAQIASASQAAEGLRAQKTEALVETLAARVRRALTAEQAALIEHELAPTGDQPWRRYSGALRSPAVAATGRPPMDPTKWLKELRSLRAVAAQGDPQAAVEAFARKLARGLRAGTPHYEQALAKGRAAGAQALSLPPRVFAQREWGLARTLAKQEWDVRDQQRMQDGKAVEPFDPYRWLVREVLLSPRAAASLHDRGAAP